MQELPVLNVTQGAPISDEFTLRGQALTGWTGEAKFKRRYPLSGLYDYAFEAEKADKVFLTAPASVTVSGADTVVALDVADTSGFPALERMGAFVTAFCEVRLTGPSGDVQVFQRPVAVAGAF